MNKNELVRRYVFLLAGLFVNALGVTLITKGDLGTSPITSIPYTLSLGFAPTIGMFTFFMNLLLVALQAVLLKKDFKLSALLQIPVVFLFSAFIDLTMIMFSSLAPESYPSKFILLIIGCFVLGFGVFMEMEANVVMLPGEATVRAITHVTGRDFGKTKIVFDSSMTVTAIIISFVLFHTLCGVREGTVIAALAVGFTAKMLKRYLGKLELILIPGKYSKARFLKQLNAN